MNSLEVDEQRAIKYWTSSSPAKHYRAIKKASENKHCGKTHDIQDIHNTWFNSLENLFEKYEDNTTAYESIYRADIIENKGDIKLSDDQLFFQYCNEYTIGKTFDFDDMLVSFSACKDEAMYVATKNDKYKNYNTPIVLYILEERKSKYLYIANYSQLPEEKEILSFGKRLFKVVNQEIFENNYVEISIVEITI